MKRESHCEIQDVLKSLWIPVDQKLIRTSLWSVFEKLTQWVIPFREKPGSDEGRITLHFYLNEGDSNFFKFSPFDLNQIGTWLWVPTGMMWLIIWTVWCQYCCQEVWLLVFIGKLWLGVWQLKISFLRIPMKSFWWIIFFECQGCDYWFWLESCEKY